ncbi:WPE palindromic element domain-containing protein [Wolbachia endosymbiont (group A) of Anthophora plumipes]|uniref:WPE palindromic element domain-containing protein n=1 Tax=Wolbachia endosymbiont (group A) of Anthophora plumipes TaxID=3066194 RepID=UPI00334004BB
MTVVRLVPSPVIPVPRYWDPVSPYDGVMKVADTGFHPKRCHSSLESRKKNGVIPVPRHWDPENLILTKWLHNKDWIPDWNDTLLNRHTAIHSRYLSR